MAKFRITAPTGETFEITAPEGATEQQVMQFAKQHFASRDPGAAPAAPAQPAGDGIDYSADRETVRKAIAARPAADRPRLLKAWATATVAKEREGGGLGQWLNDRARTLSRGTPVGSWLDEANALLASGAHKVTSGAVGSPYDEAVAYERAQDDARDKEASLVATIPGVGDVTTATLEKLAGGLLSARGAPGITVARGQTMLPQLANATATGAGYGALYGAGEGEGMDRVTNGLVGTAIGGLLGPGFYLGARGIGNAYTWAANKLARKPGALAQYEPRAVEKMARMAEDDGLPASYARQAAELGPEGMLGDMGQNLRMGTARIARNPGEGRTTVLDALNARKEGAPGRITQDVDAALGPPVNVPETVDTIRRQANTQARPYYDQFYQSPLPVTQEVQAVLQRAEAGGLLNQARRTLALQGHNPDAAASLPRLLDQLKRSADDAAGLARQQGEHEAHMIYTQFARDVRRAADAASGGGAYRMARDISGTGQQFEEAVDLGRGAFSKSLSPDQMRYDIQHLRSPAAQQAYGVAARDQVRQIMGNSATAYGPNGDNAARRALGADNAREKLDIIAGPQGARQLTRRLDAETTFERTRDMADRNSITSTMQAAEKLFPGEGASDIANKLGAKSFSGVAMEAAYRVANILTGGAINEGRQRVAAHAAEMLVAQGVRRDEIARALLQYVSQNQVVGARRVAIERLARDLMMGARAPLIEGALN